MKTRHSAEKIVSKLRQAGIELGKGLKVAEVCKRLGISEQAALSQEALGARSGLSRHYLSELESGKRNPSLQVLMRLAKGLKVTLKDLVDFG